MARSTQSHSVRQEGGQPFGLEGAKEMIIQGYLRRYLYYSNLGTRDATGTAEQGIGSPRRILRRLLEGGRGRKKCRAKDVRSGTKPEDERASKKERVRTKEHSGRVPEGKAEQRRRSAPER